MEHLPKYRCIKEVHGFKIGQIIKESTETKLISISGRIIVTVDAPYMEKHNPQINGYYVLYEDGYESYSPAKAFEEGYILINE